MTIEVLDAFGAVVGTAKVKWADVFKWDVASIGEVHRVFDEPLRLVCPPGRNDPRMLWSLRTRLA